MLDGKQFFFYHSVCLIFNFRKHQWIKLSRRTPFTFLSVENLVELNINFKDACKRIWKICVKEVSDDIKMIYRCAV